MQFNKSDGELSIEKMDISNSDGRHRIGDSSRLLFLSTSWTLEEVVARDDWESLDWDMRNSLSSSTILSGEADAEDSDAGPLEDRVLCRERENCCMV